MKGFQSIYIHLLDTLNECSTLEPERGITEYSGCDADILILIAGFVPYRVSVVRVVK